MIISGPLRRYLHVAVFITAVAAGGAVAIAAGLVSQVDRRALERIENPPLGLPEVPVPDENPVTAEKIALGRKLFFDRRLSANGTMSCGMCHIPEQGFTNNELATPVGMNGRSVRRNAPTILNVAYQKTLFHDGRETSLETQVVAPLIAANEMANISIGAVIERLSRLDDYEARFRAAFGGGPSVDRLGQAIASWQRSLLAGNSPFDRWYFGDRENALSDQQKRGFEIFSGKGNCIACHPVGQRSALFSDHLFHNTGVGYRAEQARKKPAQTVRVELAPGVFTDIDHSVVDSVGDPPAADAGRLEVTQRPEDLGRFKTPSLRNVALTAPYMHDGSLRTLRDVIRFYNDGGAPNPGLDPLIGPLDLTTEEMAALAAFLESLTADDIAMLIEDARSAPVGN